jgi:hypothetical protein
MNSLPTEPREAELAAHITRTLTTVAESIRPEMAPAQSDLPGRSPSGKRFSMRAVAVAAALVSVSAGLIGWKALGPGDIERIPVEAALAHGSADGYDWWLIPSAAVPGHTNPCGVASPGVEIISAATNRPGEQWDTGGVNYGEFKPVGNSTQDSEGSGAFAYDCSDPQSDFDEEAWLPDPVLHDLVFTRMGRNNNSNSPWAAATAVHPSIDLIELVVDGQIVKTVQTVSAAGDGGGPRYAGFTIASDVCAFTLNYHSAGQIVTSDYRALC